MPHFSQRLIFSAFFGTKEARNAGIFFGRLAFSVFRVIEVNFRLCPIRLQLPLYGQSAGARNAEQEDATSRI